MRIFVSFALFLAWMLVGPGPGVFAEGRAAAYQVIVHPHNPATSVERVFLTDAFLKKVATWPSGEALHPVDLIASSRVRQSFSEEVLHRSVADVKGYWQQRIFSGRDVPPPEFDTDEDVIKYVLKYDGAVGYVSENVHFDADGPRVVAVR
jgi:hypothetical protein